MAAATLEVKDFTTNMQSDDTKKLFHQAVTSRKENPGPIRPWLVTDHPDWCEPRRSRQTQQSHNGTARNNDENDEDELQSEVPLDAEMIRKLLANWKDAHPGARARFDEKTGLFKVGILIHFFSAGRLDSASPSICILLDSLTDFCAIR